MDGCDFSATQFQDRQSSFPLQNLLDAGAPAEHCLCRTRETIPGEEVNSMQLQSNAPPAMTMEIPSSPIGPIPLRPVATIKEASRIFCLIRDRLRWGSSDFGDALIRDEPGIVVAHVS